MKSELVKPAHLARKAVVYIRQSTPHQVVSNQESLRLQYALRQRARELGWHEADIDVIDADLGLSGASIARRSGFKELVGAWFGIGGFWVTWTRRNGRVLDPDGGRRAIVRGRPIGRADYARRS